MVDLISNLEFEAIMVILMVLGVRKKKVNVAGIYSYWNMNEVKKYEPALDETEIKKLFGITK